MGVHSSEKQITAIRFSNSFQESPEMTGPTAKLRFPAHNLDLISSRVRMSSVARMYWTLASANVPLQAFCEMSYITQLVSRSCQWNNGTVSQFRSFTHVVLGMCIPNCMIVSDCLSCPYYVGASGPWPTFEDPIKMNLHAVRSLSSFG